MAKSGPKAEYIGYPASIEASPTAPYQHTLGKNPVLSGISLSIASSAVTYVSPLAGLFWNNAGFGSLRKVSELDDYEPRYDPTVIPTKALHTEEIDVTKEAERLYAKTDSAPPNTIIGQFYDAYKAGRTTPSKVVDIVFELIDSEQHVNDFLSVKRDEVRTAAEASTQRYKEDEVDLDGHSKILGSNIDFTNPKGGTSWCVRKWEEAGAIIIGKLNMHEFGLDTCGNNPLHGTPINPHNAAYYPGGSSSASATTVASNLLPLTLGCDGGGSIRIPSSFNGIYGLKPTHRRVSRSPTVSLAFSTSVAGPMAGCMADLELGYRIMATPNPDDEASAQFSPPIPPSLPSTRPKTLGICHPWFDAADPSVHNLCSSALSYYTSLGYNVVPITLPHLHASQLAHGLTILTEVSTAAPSSLSKFQPGNKILLSVARQTPAHDFLLAQKLRALLMSHLAHLWEENPGMLIVSPTTPIAGWPFGPAAECQLGGYGVSDANMSMRNMTYVWLANFVGCPAISIPVGRVQGKGGKGKVPVGLMAMGEWGDEEGLIEWGKIGEEWAWGEEGRMERPGDGAWVDVLGLADGRDW